MADDLVEKLRFCANLHPQCGYPENGKLFGAAAARITALEDHARVLARELNEDGDLTGGPLEMRLRAIVRKILKHHNVIDGVIEADIVSGILRVAFEEYQKIMEGK